jgi:hypothetical protein
MHRLLAAVALGPAAGLPALADDAPAPAPLVFTHVTVIDATGAAPMPDRTVVIRDGRIAERGKWLPRPALDKMLADVAAANEPGETKR